jgi:hypothetical protein
MALPVSITVTIFLSYITLYIKKELSFLNNSILFMVMAIVTKNYMTIMNMQLKLFKTTEDSLLFLCLLLNREFVIPLLIVIFSNLFYQKSSWSGRLLLFIATAGFIQFIDLFSVYFGIVEFTYWNLYYALFVNIGYIIIGLGISKSLVIISRMEGHQHDSNL